MGKSYDRLLGILASLTGGLVIYVTYQWTSARIKESKKEDARKKKEYTTTKDGVDEFHDVRYRQKLLYYHDGACHCQRVRFRIKAPKILKAVDIPSKIRFPRLSLPIEHFEAITSYDGLMSSYAVIISTDNKSFDSKSPIGVHTFCSYCGVHILYSPTLEPREIHVNVDCLDRKHVERVHVSYVTAHESVACPVTFDEIVHAPGSFSKGRSAAAVISQ